MESLWLKTKESIVFFAEWILESCSKPVSARAGRRVEEGVQQKRKSYLELVLAMNVSSTFS